MIGVAPYQSHRADEVIIGVDTHTDQHVAVAIDGRGVRLGEKIRACDHVWGTRSLNGGPAAWERSTRSA